MAESAQRLTNGKWIGKNRENPQPSVEAVDEVSNGTAKTREMREQASSFSLILKRENASIAISEQ
jgi:hypothetical protein